LIRKPRQISPENLWNRLARDLIYDAKQVLLYAGIKVPVRKDKGVLVDYSNIVTCVTKGARAGALYDPTTMRIHFEPEYIQTIIDAQNRFDFPVFDKSFGPGGIGGYIQTGYGETSQLETPSLNHILKQAMIAQNMAMPFACVSARQLGMYEVAQFDLMTNIYDGPVFYNVVTAEGIDEAQKYSRKGHYVITNHTVFDSPLTFTYKKNVDVFMECARRGLPVYLVTMPLSGQNGPITPYGIALLAFAEFLAGMAIAYAVNPEAKVINGAYPAMCTAGRKPVLKIGSVAHNFANYLVAYTSRLLDIPSIQSGCTIEGNFHANDVLGTDYQTVRAVLLWEDMFEGWHMLRHTYGFVADLVSFSFEKAQNDIAALRHIQSLEDEGITAVIANNVRLNRDLLKADALYKRPTLIFNREKGDVAFVIVETMDVFNGDFGRHDHTLKNIPSEWF
jgi:hypothetical protein